MHGICDQCGEACSTVERDLGIGPYEFWGSREVHHDWREVSPCCEAEVVEGDVKLVRRTQHTARKAHGKNIQPGDRYELRVFRHHRKDGPSWITTTKRRLP